MHESSHEAMRAFVRVHLGAFRGQGLEILDFGSQMVDGQELSYPQLLDDPAWRYQGLDIESGLNVDITVDDPYKWDGVDSDSFDLVISGQAFEHVEYFWASMFEIVRVLRPGGLATVIAPSAGFEHRYPVDCWRFYRDGFTALSRYVGCDIVDVFTDWGHSDWADSILVARKPVWDDDGRRQFAERSALQRALVGSAEFDAACVDIAEAAEPSPLRAVQPGALTAELGSMRVDRLEREMAERHAAEAATEARIDAEAARRTEERVAAELERLAAESAANPAPAANLVDRVRRRLRRSA